MRVPGIPDRRARLEQESAQLAAAEAAALAGMPEPSSEETGASLDAIRSALSVISEKLANQERQVAALRSQPDPAPRAAFQASAQGALTIAELRDRLRAIASSADGAASEGDPARINWIIGRLDEALGQLNVVEFLDEGSVDPARNHVVDRLPASPVHPAGTIASTARSGLLFHGEVLRPQQVVIYVEQAN